MRSPLSFAILLLGMLLFALGLTGVMLVGCSDTSATPRVEAVWTEAGGARVYTVRGQIVQLPTSPTTEFQVRHEAIADFEDRNGDEIGMDVMIMPFPLARGVSIEGLAVGDKIEFDMAVNWNQAPSYAMTRVRKLPAETELDWTTLK